MQVSNDVDESRRRQQQQQQQGSSGGVDADPADDGLDLSHLCYPLLGSLLLIMWWCQVVYSHYFSMASSMSLLSLTVLFVASIANTYLY